ncbi:MAG: alginate export family protein [Syntrophobacterales bacterium]|nr:alginate export family protein [Syntrophobacterales bacterium]
MGRFVLCLAVFVFMYASSAMAVDVKVSGSFDVAGMYEAHPTMTDAASTAFMFQRLKIKTVFEVSPGLSLTTQFAALEKIWGDNRWGGTRGDTFGRPSSGTGPSAPGLYDYDMARENIEIQQVYLSYSAGKIGNFNVGYVPHDTVWGTQWGTSERPVAMVQWGKRAGDFIFGAKYMKNVEGSRTHKGSYTGSFVTDADKDSFSAVIVYRKSFIDTGFKWAYLDARERKPLATGGGVIPASTEQFKTTGHLLTPYIIMTFGGFKIEAEVEHFTGKRKYDDNSGKDIGMQSWSAYLDGSFNKGPFGVGATLAYASGDDPATRGRMEGLPDSTFSTWGGLDYNPGLILWNDDRNVYRGALGSRTSPAGTWQANVRSGVSNAKMVSVYGNYRPTESWDLKLVYLFARADELPVDTGGRFVSKNIGHELDFIATYKITNNLSYMVGAGYLWAGDFFKGSASTLKVKDDYLFTNKLSLTF